MLSKIFTRTKSFRFFSTSASQSTAIFPNRLRAVIESKKDEKGQLASLIDIFNSRNLNLHYIDGKKLEQDPHGYQRTRFNLSFDAPKDSIVQEITNEMKNMNLKMRISEPPTVPWFPMKLSDLDDMGTDLQDPDQGLADDHPGFTDKEYIKRRDQIAALGIGYKMGDQIKDFDYNAAEDKLWGECYNRIYGNIKLHACAEYKENFTKLQNDGIFSEHKIPSLNGINNFLQENTNWRIKPVNGILSQREFLNLLAFRTFACTQYIRHSSFPDFTPEPDIMHEFLGHIPMFASPVVCDISQMIGQLSLGATDQQLAMLGSIYWFTLEFGLCYEDGERKFYGAGVGSSFGEQNNYLVCEDNRELDLAKETTPTSFVVQGVQPFYYVAKSFENVLEQLEDLSESMHKPFNVRYNFGTSSYDVDRCVRMKPKPVGEEDSYMDQHV